MKDGCQDRFTVKTLRKGDDRLLLNRVRHVLELCKLLGGLLDLLPALDDLLHLSLLSLVPLDGLLRLLLLGAGEWIVLGVFGLLLLTLPLLVLGLLLCSLLLLLGLDGISLLLGVLDALLDKGIDGHLLVSTVNALNVERTGLVLALDAELLHVDHGGANEFLGSGESLMDGELGRATRANDPRAGIGLGGRAGFGLGLLATARGLGSASSLARSSTLARGHFESVLIFFEVVLLSTMEVTLTARV